MEIKYESKTNYVAYEVAKIQKPDEKVNQPLKNGIDKILDVCERKGVTLRM